MPRPAPASASPAAGVGGGLPLVAEEVGLLEPEPEDQPPASPAPSSPAAAAGLPLSPTASAAGLSVPQFTVGGEDKVCRYHIHLDGAPFAQLRWSELEAVLKQLRAQFSTLPKRLELPKYATAATTITTTITTTTIFTFYFELPFLLAAFSFLFSIFLVLYPVQSALTLDGPADTTSKPAINPN